MRKIVLYSYHSDEQRFSQTNNLVLEREVVGIETYKEHEITFAINTLPVPRIRVTVASKPGEVYYDNAQHIYRVWFDNADRDKAIEAIGNYILDQVAIEIRTHESFIKRLQKEQANASELLKKIPEV